MGRRENPLDPATGPVERFAHELRELRRAAGGPTYRAMAEHVTYAAGTLSEAAAGDRLPSLPVALAYVRACGGDAVEWERRWRAASVAAHALPPPDDGGDSPYPGLARFEPTDQARFFGRERLVDDLAALVRDRRFAVLVGASGSGKSSLLRAGLIPVLRDATPETDRPAAIRILTPGEQPLRVHAPALKPAAGTRHTWVIVDQFEELFTLCQSREERAGFLDALLTAVETDGRLRVVVSLRADFYGRLAEHADLAEAVREATLLVAPMRREELRAAIVKPAAAQGLIVERALTARVISDIEGEPGGLPLMSHALRETWRRRRGRTLTLAEYEAAGGVHGAIAHTAEHFYTGLSADQSAITRHLLLRLITPGEGAQDTRRPTPRAELEAGEAADIGPLLAQLARARLVTVDEDTVDLAHEALITAWPRLHAWIDQDRQRLRVHRQLTEAAASWDELGRDAGALYRGSRLATAEEAFPPERHDQLTTLERTFLTTSLETRHREQRMAARATRRLRVLAGTLSLLLVFSLVATTVAVLQQRNATAAEQVARSRQLAAQSVALLASEPDLAALLAIEAYRTSPTAEATAGLYTAAALPLRHRLAAGDAPLWDLAFDSDGTLVTAGFDDTLRRWDATTGALLGTVQGSPADGFGSALFSPDGRTLATTGEDGVIRIRGTATGEQLTAIGGPSGYLTPLAFNQEGTVLATGTPEGSLHLYDTATGQPLDTPAGLTTSSTWAAFTPDGATLAAVGPDRVLRAQNLASGDILPFPNDPDEGVLASTLTPDGRALAVTDGTGAVRIHDMSTGRLQLTLTDAEASMDGLAFSPDGTVLAIVGRDDSTRLWDVATGRTLATLGGHTGPVQGLAFSPDGATLATAGGDGARIWNVDFGRGVPEIEIPDDMSTAVFSPDGQALATMDGDGVVRVADARTGDTRATLTGRAEFAATLAFSPDGATLAAGNETDVLLWDAASGQSLTTVRLGGLLNAVVFSPDGTVLATGDAGGAVRLIDRTTRRVRSSLSQADGVRALAFSPDGATLAASGSGAIRLWDLAGNRTRTTLPSPGEAVSALAFSPDGATLAAASADDTVRLWDMGTSRTRATLTGLTDSVESLLFNRDGTTLTAVEGNGTVRRWQLTLPKPAEAISGICRALNRDLTSEERALHLPDASARPLCPPEADG
ncbi:hypothetical protein [Streptomyces hainanensis]|uniref:HTH cro/C1-type domain-containing protein n=1 Tax=Streptomyces hainanensis TaxID=402648 RepID=A0A4R4TQQ2_9ACTN|nr:hypothetical protein [Streptomyces hainanensis]TDC79076.1 hypothetical protein E1283_03470 [Streptomyces hainanensis]